MNENGRAILHKDLNRESQKVYSTESKRRDLLMEVEKLLAPEECVQGVVAVGSVATGHAGPRSDIDAIIFMEPVDLYVVSTESIWCPWDGTFHSIFVEDTRIHQEGIQLDLKVRSLAKWQNESFAWPDPEKAGLAQGWIAFDRDGAVHDLIARRTTYDDGTRRRRLDQAVTDIDQALLKDEPGRIWRSLGALRAFGRLATALDALIEALFAYNRRWRFFRDREMEHLEQLPWLPDDFTRRLLAAIAAPRSNEGGFRLRANAIMELFSELLEKMSRNRPRCLRRPLLVVRLVVFTPNCQSSPVRIDRGTTSR